MKFQPSYRSPFAMPGFFEKISRREAAQLLGQWRRNGTLTRRMKVRAGRGYFFHGESGKTAALVLK